MEWNVKNALNRDTERQHLNKILADIRAAYNELASKKASTGNVSLDALASAVEGNIEEGITVTYDPQKQTLDFVVNSFTIRLTGDVTGEGEVNALGSVTLTTELDPNLIGVEEAPIDNQVYWRKNGEWEIVPDAIYAFLELKDEGVPILYQDPVSHAYSWVIRVFETEAGELTVENANGKDGNPTFGLADLEDTGEGTALVKITRDSKGRVEGTESATTDDLLEGSTNLYFTDERARAAVGTVSGGEILVAEGISAPPIMLTNEAEDDFIYSG